MRDPCNGSPDGAAGPAGAEACLPARIRPDPATVERVSGPERLTRRAEFLRVGKGRRWHGKAVTVQMSRQPDGEGGARVGFTLTKKVGCAVVRNRARGRLREAVRLSPELPLRPDNDYVIVGRIDAVRLPFAELKRELARAVTAVHRTVAEPARGYAEGSRGGRRRGKGDGRPEAPAAGPVDVAGASPPNSAEGAHPAERTLERTKSTP